MAIDSTSVELGSLGKDVQGLSSKIDDLGKNLSNEEKKSIIDGLHSSDITLKDLYDFLQESLTDEMNEIVSILEKGNSSVKDELSELKKSLGGTGGAKKEEKIEKAQKGGKMETFINQVDRKYLAGAIVLHSDLEIVNTNLEKIIKGLSGNQAANKNFNQKEAKIKNPVKAEKTEKESGGDKKSSKGVKGLGEDLQSLADGILAFGGDPTGIMLGLSLYNHSLSSLIKSMKKTAILAQDTTIEKALEKVSDAMKSIEKIARTAVNNVKYFISGNVAITFAKKFIQNVSKTFSKLNGTILDKVTSESIKALGDAIVSLGKAAKVATLNAGFFLLGSLGIKFAALFALSSKSLAQQLSSAEFVTLPVGIINAQNLKILLDNLGIAALKATLFGPVFAIGCVGILMAAAFAGMGRWLVSVMNYKSDVAIAVANSLSILTILKTLTKAAAVAFISAPIYIFGMVGIGAGMAFVWAFKFLNNQLSKLGVKEILENELKCRGIAALAVELTIAATALTLGIPMFIFGLVGIIAANIFIEAFNTLGMVLASIRGNLGTMLITAIGLGFVSAALLVSVAIMAQIAKFKFMDILKALLMITSITVASAVLGGLMYAVSPALAWIALGSVIIAAAFGSLLLALMAMEKISQFDLEAIKGALVNIGEILIELVKMIPNLLLGAIAGIFLGLFGISFAIGAWTVYLGMIALNKIAEFQLDSVIAGLENIKVLTEELGRALPNILLGTISSIFLAVFGLTFALGAGFTLLGLFALSKIAEFEHDVVVGGLENIKFLVQEIGKYIGWILLGTVASVLLAIFSASFAGSTILLFGAFKMLTLLHSKFKREDLTKGFENIKFIASSLGKAVGWILLGTISALLLVPFSAALFMSTLMLKGTFAALKKIGSEYTKKDVEDSFERIKYLIGKKGLGSMGLIELGKATLKGLALAATGGTLLLASLSFLLTFESLKKLKDIADGNSVEAGFNSIKMLFEKAEKFKYDKKAVKNFLKSADDIKEVSDVLFSMTQSLNAIAQFKVEDSVIKSRVETVFDTIDGIMQQITNAANGTGPNGKKRNFKKDGKNAEKFAVATKAVSEVTDFMGNIVSNIDAIKEFKSDPKVIDGVNKVIDTICVISGTISTRINTKWSKLKSSFSFPNMISIKDNQNLNDEVFKPLSKKAEFFLNSIEAVNAALGAIESLKVEGTSLNVDKINQVVKGIDSLSLVGAGISTRNLNQTSIVLSYVKDYGSTVKTGLLTWKDITAESIDALQAPVNSVKALVKELVGAEIPTAKEGKGIDKALKYIKKYGADIRSIFKTWEGITTESILALQPPIRAIKDTVIEMNNIPPLSEHLLGKQTKKSFDMMVDTLRDFSKVDYAKLADSTVEKSARNVSLLISSMSGVNSESINGIEKMMKSFNVLSDKNISKNLDKLSDVNDKIQSKWGDTVINQVTFDAVVNSLTLLSSIIKNKAMNVRVINEQAGEEENKPFQIKKLGGN